MDASCLAPVLPMPGFCCGCSLTKRFSVKCDQRHLTSSSKTERQQHRSQTSDAVAATCKQSNEHIDDVTSSCKSGDYRAYVCTSGVVLFLFNVCRCTKEGLGLYPQTTHSKNVDTQDSHEFCCAHKQRISMTSRDMQVRISVDWIS